jgi:uncharacterized glyoxalase superfamily protein PhnB
MVMAPTLNAIGMTVADMAKTLDFYRRLGLDFPPGAEAEGHVEAAGPGGIRLMWDTNQEIQKFDSDFTPNSGGGPSLAFLCADAAEVDSVHAELVKAGATSTMEPWDADWGQRYATIKDLDGYALDLFAWTTKP